MANNLTPAQVFIMDCLQAAPGRSFKFIRVWYLYEGDARFSPSISVHAGTLLALAELGLIQLNVESPGEWDQYALKETRT